MNDTRFKILYIIFIVICILYPSKYIVGPISIRHIISLIMLASCLLEGFRADKYLFLYCGFLLFLGISSVATGFGGTFFNKLFGTYLPIVAAYASTFLLIKKFEGTNLLVWTIVCIGVLNAIVTIGQFFNWTVVDELCSILRFEIDEKYTTISDIKESEGITLPGLFNSVENGYFLSATALLVLFNKKSSFYLNVLLWSIVMAASFLAQERAGFMLAIIFSAFIIGKHFISGNNVVGFIVVTILFVVCAYFIINHIDDLLSSDFRYIKGFEEGNRGEYRYITWRYIFNNPMGGFYEFDSTGYNHPHNFILNAFLFGGFFGGICVLLLLTLQIIRIIPYLYRNTKSEYSQWAFIWGLMYVDYSIVSMVHNASIVQGIMPFFIWWGAFLAYAEFKEEEKTFEVINERDEDIIFYTKISR